MNFQLTPGVFSRQHSPRYGALGQDLRLQLCAVAPALTTVVRIHRVQLFVNWTGSLSPHGFNSRRVRRTLTGHEPYAYLKDVLERLPTQPASALADLLPYRWKPTA